MTTVSDSSDSADLRVIAIDGLSGSGKSTVAKRIAERLDLPYLDTGAMYRACAWVALQRGIPFEDQDKMIEIARDLKFSMLDERSNGKILPRIEVDSTDITTAIREEGPTHGSSAVAVIPGVREALVAQQRHWVESRRGGVVEGRDIGSVVFPNATLKVYLTASAEQRARRRLLDQKAQTSSNNITTEEVEKKLTERDHRDSSRAASPLVATQDAIVIDTSDRTIDEVVDEIVAELAMKTSRTAPRA